MRIRRAMRKKPLRRPVKKPRLKRRRLLEQKTPSDHCRLQRRATAAYEHEADPRSHPCRRGLIRERKHLPNAPLERFFVSRQD